MIEFSCPNCGSKYRLPDDKGGKKGKCSKCGTSMTIPAGPGAAAEPVTGGSLLPPAGSWSDGPVAPGPAAGAADASMPSTIGAGSAAFPGQPGAGAAPPKARSRLGLVLALVGGGVAVLVAAALAAYFLLLTPSVGGTMAIQFKGGSPELLANAKVYVLPEEIKLKTVLDFEEELMAQSRAGRQKYGEDGAAYNANCLLAYADSFYRECELWRADSERPDDARTDMAGVLSLLNWTYGRASNLKRNMNPIIDLSERVKSEGFVASGTTDATGNYRIKDIPQGAYCLYAVGEGSQGYVVWIIPFDMPSRAQVTFNLNGDNSRTISWK